MTTRARNALVLAAFAVVATLGLFGVWRIRQRPDLRQGALDAVPNGALLVVTAELGALRSSAIGGRFLQEGREIPGLGKVRDVCGFGPLEVLSEVAIAVPAHRVTSRAHGRRRPAAPRPPPRARECSPRAAATRWGGQMSAAPGSPTRCSRPSAT